MFGYITPFKPQLKLCDMELYKSVYCGLCRKLSRFGKRNKFLLSYDLTFYTLLSLSIQKENPEFERGRCILSPKKSKSFLKDCESLRVASSLNVILFYYKLKDNINDEKYIKKMESVLCKFVFGKAQKRASTEFPNIHNVLERMQVNQQLAEEGRFRGIDYSCDPFSKALGELFCIMPGNKEVQPALKRTGYMAGRFAYLMDALEDLEPDLKAKRFNPFIEAFNLERAEDLNNREIYNYAYEAINITIAQLAAAYELLPVKRYKSILDNIIYLGLKCRLKSLIEDKTKIGIDKIIFSNKKEIADGKSI